MSRSGDVVHAARIQAQFTQQADTFGQVRAHSSSELMQTLLTLAEPAASDVALDVACGPGIVTCAFAPHVGRITGQDIVAAMLEQARARQTAARLTNVEWLESDAGRLPFDAASIDLVLTRFSVHHFMHPQVNIAEMRRVCKPSGRVVIMDASPTPEHGPGYDAFELLRDPSHARALPEAELVATCERSGLRVVKVVRTHLDVDFEEQLQASFPDPNSGNSLREMIARDLEAPFMGLAQVGSNGKTLIRYPILGVLAVPALAS
jgi:ubiquinone/menaquinone biosynthesis C-methylase UbiE